MLVYEGPGLAARIADELEACRRRDGLASIAEATGKGL
jgi:dihydroorotate dehydrogenase